PIALGTLRTRRPVLFKHRFSSENARPSVLTGKYCNTSVKSIVSNNSGPNGRWNTVAKMSGLAPLSGSTFTSASFVDLDPTDSEKPSLLRVSCSITLRRPRVRPLESIHETGELNWVGGR